MKSIATVVLFLAWMMLTVMASILFGQWAALAALLLPAFAFILATENGPRKQ
jgi:hypothetical protein